MTEDISETGRGAPDHTIDIGYVHVGRPVGPHAPMTGKWVCADNCPHPDHSGRSEPQP